MQVAFKDDVPTSLWRLPAVGWNKGRLTPLVEVSHDESDASARRQHLLMIWYIQLKHSMISTVSMSSVFLLLIHISDTLIGAALKKMMAMGL